MKITIAHKFFNNVAAAIIKLAVRYRNPRLLYYCLRMLGTYGVVSGKDISRAINFTHEAVDDFRSDSISQDLVGKLGESVLGFSLKNSPKLGKVLRFICELDLAGADGSPKWFLEKLADKVEVLCVIEAIKNSGLTDAKINWCLSVLMQQYCRLQKWTSAVRLFCAIVGQNNSKARLQYFYILALVKSNSPSLMTEVARIDLSRFLFSQVVSLFCRNSISDAQRTGIENSLLESGNTTLLQTNVTILWLTSFFSSRGVVGPSVFSSNAVSPLIVADYLYANIFDGGAAIIGNFMEVQRSIERPVLYGPIEQFLSTLSAKVVAGEVSSHNVGPLVRRFFGRAIAFSVNKELQKQFFGRLLFRGAYTLEQLLKPCLTFDSPSDVKVEEEGALVITTSDRYLPEFLTGDKQSYKVITLNRRVGRPNSVSIGELWNIVSKEDFEALINVCSKVSEFSLNYNSPLGRLCRGEFIKETVDVALEDSLFPYLRNALTIDAYVKENGCKSIYFHSTESDFQKNLGYALFLQRIVGVRVFFTFYNKFWASSAALLLSGGKKTLPSLLLGDLYRSYKGIASYYRNGANGLCELFDSPVDTRVKEASVRHGALVFASINDPSYRSVAFSAANALSGEFNTRLMYIAKDQLSKNFSFGVDKLPVALESDGLDDYLYDHSEMLRCLGQSDLISDCPIDIFKLLEEYTYLEFIPPIIQFVVKQLPLLFVNVKKLIVILREENINLVVAIPGRHPAFRGALLFSEMNALPSIDVQAFFTSDNPRYKYSLATSYLTITEDQKNLYEACYKERGQNARRFGSFTIDAGLVQAKQYFDQLRSLRAEDGGQGKRHIVFAAQHGLDDLNEKIITGILTLVANAGGRLVATIKAHPRSTIDVCEGYRALVTNAGVEELVTVVHKESIYKILPLSDVLVTQFSNVGLEAAALGIDVITVNLTDQPLPIDMQALGISVQVNSVEELVLSVHLLLTDEDFAEKVKRGREDYFAINHELRSCDAKQRFIGIAREMVAGLR